MSDARTGGADGPELERLDTVTRPEAFGRTLELGVTALLFDATAEGVLVPPHLRSQTQVILNFSWRYNVSDFTFDGHDARASLSFGGVPSLCVVPWTAVWCIANDARSDAWFWVATMPAAMQRSFGVAALGEAAAALVAHQSGATMQWHRAGDDRSWSAGPVAAAVALPAAKARPAWLRVVADRAEDDATDAPPEPPPTGRPTLRRIK